MLYCLYRVVLVVDRRCRTGEVVYLVDLGGVWLGNIVADKLEVVVANEVAYVVLAAREVVVEADDIIAVIEQSLA